MTVRIVWVFGNICQHRRREGGAVPVDRWLLAAARRRKGGNCPCPIHGMAMDKWHFFHALNTASIVCSQIAIHSASLLMHYCP